ncbi:MAG: penicillin-binding protein 2 [Gammaproteobacteria bacterium]|nr:penicillin-binding protein 2 [Gammaproteobacteria bacterium]MYF38064.1 penicillin-binding protein 2 [Gammaproteobacteria bacterium]
MSTKRAYDPIPSTLSKTVVYRASSAAVVATVFILLLVARLFQLQIVEHERYATHAADNRLTTQTIPPPRGLVFDRHGNILASNRIVPSLAVIKENVDDVDTLLMNVRSLVDFSATEESSLRKHLEDADSDAKVIIKRHLNDEQLAIAAVNRHQFGNILVITEILREYPLKELTSHVVGSVRQVTKEDLQQLDPVRYRGTKFVGRRGVEKFYEDVLHGDIGHRQVEVNASGRVLSQISEQKAKRGGTLTLHLDIELQRVADEALGDRRGAVVAIDPKTGGVLALVSKPSYDPNVFVTGLEGKEFDRLSTRADAPLFNRATQGKYPPGSTIKPVLGMAGLAAGVIDWELEFEDPKGEFQLPGNTYIYRDWNWSKNGTGGQGQVDLFRSIYRSSNIYYFHLGAVVDIDTFATFLGQWGYGRNTSLDIQDADVGILPSTTWKKENKDDSWYPGDSMNFVIGQGFTLVTPLQLATIATIFANRGKWVRPRLLLSSERPVDLGQNFPPVQGVAESDWERMIEALTAVVHRGHKGYLQNGLAWFHIGMDIPYQMAGKSGTAQVVAIPQGEEYDEELLPEDQRKHALFFGFAPVHDPVIAVATVIENGGGGSEFAAPVVRRVIDSFMADIVATSDE